MIFYFCVFILSLVLTYLMKRINIQDVPFERSSHSIPIPRAGGVAIIGTVFLSLKAWSYFYHFNIPSIFYTLLMTGLIMGFMGLWDDIKSTHFLPRLSIQSFCAIVCMYSGMVIPSLNLPYLGNLDLGNAKYIITFLWIIGFTNAFNFYDGLNGLSTGTTIIVLAILNFLLPPEILFYSVVLKIFISSLLGFFLFNFPLWPKSQAHIFLGDSGSQFLGFCLACLPLVFNYQTPNICPIYVMPLLFFCPLWDIGLTLVRRLIQGKNITKPHREHLFQLLQRSGWSHKQVSFLYYGFTGVQGVGAWILFSLEVRQWAIFTPYICVQIFYSAWVFKRARKYQLLST